MGKAAEVSEKLQAAIELAELGYFVCPAIPNDKPPAISRWPELATTDSNQLEEWWAENPDYNVGIHCADIVVIDIDTINGERNEYLDRFSEEDFNQTPMANSPRGGVHLFYRRPPEAKWRNSANILASGVDVRTNQGFLVCFPSTTKDGQYRWQNELPQREKLTLPPEWLMKELDEASRPSEVDWQGGGRIPESKRNATLTKHGGFLRRFGYNGREIFHLLAALNRDRCDPPVDREEVARIAESVSRYVPDPKAVAELNELGNIEETIASQEHLSVADVLALPDQKYLLADFIPADSCGMLYGASGDGKSFVALDIALFLATGLDWHGYHVGKPRRVAYVAAESTLSFKPRIEAWLSRNRAIPHDVLEENFRLVRGGPRVKDQPSMIAFSQAHREAFPNGSDLIVLDTMSAGPGAGVEENSAAEVSDMIAQLQRLAKTHGSPTILLVHHAGKSDKKSERGSSALRANLDFSLHVKAEAKSPEGFDLTLKVAKSKDSSGHCAAAVRLSRAKKSLVVSSVKIMGEPKRRFDVTKEVAFLNSLPIPHRLRLTGGSKNDFCKLLEEKMGHSRPTAYRRIDDLIEQGYIVSEHGKFKIAISQAGANG